MAHNLQQLRKAAHALRNTCAISAAWSPSGLTCAPNARRRPPSGKVGTAAHTVQHAEIALGTWSARRVPVRVQVVKRGTSPALTKTSRCKSSIMVLENAGVATNSHVSSAQQERAHVNPDVTFEASLTPCRR